MRKGVKKIGELLNEPDIYNSITYSEYFVQLDRNLRWNVIKDTYLNM